MYKMWRDVEAVVKKLSQNRYNINIQLYLIKLSQNNFATFLYLFESLNYKLNLMRNDYIFYK